MSKLNLILKWAILNWQSLIIGGVMLILVGWVWHWYSQIPQAPVGVSVPATVAPEVKNVPTVDVVVQRPITVYANNKKTKKKLNLPEVMVIDDAKSIISSSKVKADDHSHTITTVIDTKTGKTETIDRRDPLPWIAFTTKGDVMVSAGMNASGEQVGMVQVRQGILRIKAVTLGVVGNATHTNVGGAGGTMDASGMAAVWYSWGR